ncbi:rubredoxin [Arcticibacter tournemirensis]|uniref:Rubredoxin n=1 Tax=Arcticibacter tournemirensis TaxID=699437 RepID=A0A4Q0M6U1_9SPHI|nr:rubredoxin [Arcticibacter tournemirensis]
MKEGVYKDIFDQFTYRPRLKINLVDNTQTFVPFFTGNLNFISSDLNNHWYLYIRFPKTSQLCCCPFLIYSDDIPQVSQMIEEVIYNNRSEFYDQEQVDENSFFDLLKPLLNFTQPLNEPLTLPDFYLPYYEGFNWYTDNKYWLGVYRRNELFPLDFLKDVCALCLQTRIGQLYTTPWKSFLVKNIDQADRRRWENLLNKHRLNVRHAANELNWQVEDQCADGLGLKKYLVREFEEADLRTYRLCFAIKTQPRTGLFGSIVLRKQEHAWDILYTRDFNPNSKDFLSYKSRLSEDELREHLIDLVQFYYQSYSNSELNITGNSLPENEVKAEGIMKTVYQCIHCMSVYDEIYGEEISGILPGTSFDTISAYTCLVCGSSKDDFRAKEWTVLS